MTVFLMHYTNHHGTQVLTRHWSAMTAVIGLKPGHGIRRDELARQGITAIIEPREWTGWTTR